ncbi:MAG: F0F1 ATP synthase subunit B/delta [Geodermatophilaceae bacterium]|nr:F0F1 ATP synthase subunit B/delta [Geodermatophilaceae bacterium]
MTTLISELFAFAVVVFVLARYVVPPIRKAMAKQQQTVSAQLESSREAASQLDTAQQRYEESVQTARVEAAEIRDRARADADHIAGEVAQRADTEADRIRQRGEDAVGSQRSQAVRDLRKEVGEHAVHLAELIVVQALADETRRSATVDQVLTELEGMSSPETAVAPVAMARRMQGVSRDSLASVRESFPFDGDADTLGTTGDELYAVSDLLYREQSLLRLLSDAAVPENDRVAMVDRTLGQRLSTPALDALKALVAKRWSKPGDLVRSIEALALEAYLKLAEASSELDQVEDELFRLGRIVENDPPLNGMLSDPMTDSHRRAELIDRLVAGKVTPVTGLIAHNAIRSLRGRSAYQVLSELAATVAVRRQRAIAVVTAPAELTEAQRDRLSGVLGRVYGEDVSLQVEIDATMLGGLIVRVGDDLIDGSVTAQLQRVRQGLPQ